MHPPSLLSISDLLTFIDPSNLQIDDCLLYPREGERAFEAFSALKEGGCASVVSLDPRVYML